MNEFLFGGKRKTDKKEFCLEDELPCGCNNCGECYAKYKIKTALKQFEKRIIERICRPNKPINTFENAREQERIIKEELETTFGGL